MSSSDIPFTWDTSAANNGRTVAPPPSHSVRENTWLEHFDFRSRDKSSIITGKAGNRESALSGEPKMVGNRSGCSEQFVKKRYE